MDIRIVLTGPRYRFVCGCLARMFHQSNEHLGVGVKQAKRGRHLLHVGNVQGDKEC